MRSGGWNFQSPLFGSKLTSAGITGEAGLIDIPSKTDSFDASAEESGGTVAFTQDTPDQRMGRNEELVALANAINELPSDLKNAFILRTLENRPQAEAAELLGLSPKGVGGRVYRVRRLRGTPSLRILIH